MKITVFYRLFAIALVFGLVGCNIENTESNVTFDLKGGNVNGNTAPVNIQVKSGGTVENLPTPQKDCNNFNGWFTEQNGLGNEFTASTEVTSNITVYAKWSWDNDFLKLAYDKNYIYPDGFYQDESFIDQYSSVYYLHTANKPWRVDDNNYSWVELHTLDKEEARSWTNTLIENSNLDWSKNLIYKNERENEKYFEFVFVQNSQDNTITYSWLSRIHRSDYFIPLFDKINFIPSFEDFTEDKTVGIFNGDPTIGNVKELIEYLWCMSLLRYGKVVESTISEKDREFEYSIQSLEMVGGDWGLCDVIYVYDNRFVFDKETKVLTFVNRKKTETIIGKMN